MTILIVNGLWRYRYISVEAALEHSQEETLPYYENQNHVHEEHHVHDDGWCDCNSQGPWHPLFKPSQALHDADVADEGSSHSAENTLDGSQHGHVHHSLPHDLHPNPYPGLRQAKKQNHMIHLHLIPHIYVPVVHQVRNPVTYAVPAAAPSYDNQGTGSHESHEEHRYSDSNISSEQDNEIHGDHSHENGFQHDDHAPYHPPSEASSLNVPAEGTHHDIPNHTDGHSETSHESGESIQYPFYPFPKVHYHYPYRSPEEELQHQYQVHEESPREQYYGDFATGSNTKAQIVAPNTNISLIKSKNKLKFHDRSQLLKQSSSAPISMRRLRVMRPPAPAQKETWMVNLPHSPEKKIYPINTLFDSKSFLPSSFFNFKPAFAPQKMIQPMNPSLPVPVPLANPPVGKYLHSPTISLYPSNMLRKREDKLRKMKT